MAYIKNRKHAQPRFNTRMTAAIAGALLLPAAAHAQQSQLPSVEVTATQDGGYKAERASSAKYTQPLVDTPQTLQVIKRQLIDQQNATTLTEALRNSPGVSTFYLGENGSTSTGDAIYMRGFDASGAIFVDSVRDLGSVSRDMFNIQQVEVLKGPAGTDNGRGSPTGSINLVTKQAELNDSFGASATYGSWGQKRATADWNKLLNADNGTALRLNLMKQDSGVPGRHEVNNDHSGIAASLANGLGTGTRIFLDYLHMEQNDVPDGGVPTIGLPGYRSPQTAAAGATPAIPPRAYVTSAPRVNSSNFYGLTSDYNDVSTDRVTLRVEHDFSPDVKLQNTTRYGRTHQNYLLTSFMGSAANLVTPNPADRSTWTIARSNPTIKDQTNTILTNQTYLTANLQTGAIKHTLMGGVEFTQEKQDNVGYDTSGALPAANLYNPNPNAGRGTWAMTPNAGLNSSGKTSTVSAYLFDTLKFNDRWSVNGGVRVDHYDTDSASGYKCVTSGRGTLCPTGVAAGTLFRQNFSTNGNLFNWKLAGIYKPTENSSVYALYATSQLPPGGNSFALSATANSADNPNFAAQKTKTAEIGTKWDVLNKKLALTAALYRTEVNNEVELDATSGQYFQTGKKTVQGIELGVTGEVTPNLSLTAGYTYMNTKVNSGAVVTANGENNLAYTPKQAFTSWATYKLPQGFTIGGGGRYVSSLLRGSDDVLSGTPQYADSYWVFDGMAGYVVNKNLDLQLNLYNIFNKDYVAAINKSGYRYTPGTPRAVTLTANLKF
ncbi:MULTISPECIES: catecholate siderophore receptor Fiu [unclassified Herbaspirillum]|uniref:catecholate siderophore receptor Fiu n=1 Tax=unclassified Herbaspirillum TaxID=2624150 RepID=UPI000E2F200B|nr:MULTISPECIES: catecholate siderophore receptor Fiu [unclassified Herbaspirillum]RFB68040.1 catecholate siderophore receptor Fiu [Herbaspirillum sp. 3R-3a1]TFI06483.1 catecholate siderophore receptor Fiu [Herbaspirillum sp. 3R11]TFI13905.1 catecholate siderophore receptor Fiu [Herbaspirillum sp. 3R-11]TFI31022.1 catecholate siderophore receptor Fiu [Herbaspirillum sp. 3C11]